MHADVDDPISRRTASIAHTLASRALQGDVDEALKALHERLSALHSAYNDVHGSLKHQATVARKMAKIEKELQTANAEIKRLDKKCQDHVKAQEVLMLTESIEERNPNESR